MTDVFRSVARLRADAGTMPDAPLVPELILPHCYPAACVLLPALCVSALRDYLDRHGATCPPGLITCRDRRLRGGIVARKGFGLLFADAEDPEEERRFTLAHEAAHFLQDHLYPRQDLLERFGPDILPVLDGLRPPTREERIDALLARTTLTLQTHLLDRDTNVVPERFGIEADADAFACEVLAPRAALERRFPTLTAGDTAVAEVQAALTTDFALPTAPALRYARAFVSQRAEPVTLLHRLGLLRLE